MFVPVIGLLDQSVSFQFSLQGLAHIGPVVSEVFTCAFATAARAKVVKMNPARMVFVFVNEIAKLGSFRMQPPSQAPLYSGMSRERRFGWFSWRAPHGHKPVKMGCPYAPVDRTPCVIFSNPKLFSTCPRALLWTAVMRRRSPARVKCCAVNEAIQITITNTAIRGSAATDAERWTSHHQATKTYSISICLIN